MDGSLGVAKKGKKSMTQFYLKYPNTQRKDVDIDDRQDAIDAGMRQADEVTVQVIERGKDGDILLAEYKKRDTPLYADVDG